MNRVELRTQNLRITAQNKSNDAPFETPSNAGLDASLKKNSAMVAKLKTATHISETHVKLCAELDKLKVDKFIEEMGNSLCECVKTGSKAMSGADLLGWIRVASVLHRKSSQFLGPVLTSILTSFITTNVALVDTKNADSKTIRNQFRLLCEMVLCGLADPELCYRSGIVKGVKTMNAGMKEALKLPGGIVYYLLKEHFLTQADHKEFSNVSIAQLFSKHFALDFLNIGSEKTGNEVAFIAEAVRLPLKALLTDYYTALGAELKSLHKDLHKMRMSHETHQMTRGDLTEHQKSKLETITALYDRLLAATTALSESLLLQMPVLPKVEVEVALSTIQLVDNSNKDEDIDWSQTQWDDEEQMQFYTIFPDVKNLVPSVCLVVPEDKKATVKKSAPRKPQIKLAGKHDDYLDDTDQYEYMDDLDEEMFAEVENRVVKSEDTEDKTDADIVPIPLTRQAAVDNILLQLPNLITSSLIDNAAVEFITAQVNCRKLARSKLIQTLLGIHRFRLDLIPYYARLIAILNPYMPEVGAVVLATLHGQFRRLYRKPHRIDLENRIKNIHFIGELVKFQVCPTHILFYCIKRLTQPEASGSTFSAHHVEVTTHLLETCGHFMFRSPAAHKMFAPLVEIFQRKVKQSAFDVRMMLMVENAMMMVDPPPATAKVVKKDKLRTPLEHYIRFLILRELNSKTDDHVLDQLHMLPWDKETNMDLHIPADFSEEEVPNDLNVVVNVEAILLKLFSKIWKVKYENVEYMADIASDLAHAHPKFGTALIDSILEEVRIGMDDMSAFRYHRRRLVVVKYFAELYNYRLITSGLVFDTLFLMLCFGHPEGKPTADASSDIDPPHDYFRARLVCMILDTCGKYFNQGPVRRRLDQFLVYFQRYLFCKDKDAMPLEVGFLVHDIFNALRPGIERLSSLEEAEQAVRQIEVEVSGDAGQVVEPESLSNTPVLHRRRSESKDRVSESSSDSESSLSSLSDSDEEERHEDHQSDDDNIITAPVYSSNPEEDAEFAREFQRTMTESLDSRRNEKRSNILDLAIPMHLKKGAFASTSGESSQDVTGTEPSVQFTVLKKNAKGGKAFEKSIHLPADSEIVKSTLSKQQELRLEHQKMKQLVLGLEKASRQ